MNRKYSSELRLINDLEDMRKYRMSSRNCITQLSDIIKRENPLDFRMKACIKSLEGIYKDKTFEVKFD